MSETPFHPVFQTLEKLSHCIQTHLSNFFGISPSRSPANGRPPFSITSSSKANSPTKDFAIVQKKAIMNEEKSENPVTKEELGRATWTFLHTLAAQYPDNPTRQQKKDVKELMAILSRMYPCKECADHFKEVLRLDLKLSSPSGYVMCITLLIEALTNQSFPVRELMQGGASWIVCSVHVICKETQISARNHINIFTRDYQHVNV